MAKRNVLLMGAAGRDFHNFNVFFRDNADYDVKAFTAFQIPNIEKRRYPADLAGKLYPEGIPIFHEKEVVRLIKEMDIDDVVFAYSDIAHVDIMHRSSIVNAAGADFTLMGPKHTLVKSTKPVIAVCAVRTGCGKSQTSRAVTEILKKNGKSVAVIRHPMPYGDLSEQKCQRFETLDDLVKHKCTIEEREEYEAHINMGNIVYAGVDYEEILRNAEKEADIILWDGGNNDLPFYQPDLHIVIADPLRAGHEVGYYPGEANIRMAQVVIINKVNNATAEEIAIVKKNVAAANPNAKIIEASSAVTTTNPGAIKGKKVLVVEDGPTLTHGEMTYGAGTVAAKEGGAGEIIDPKPYAVGSIKTTFETYPHVKDLLPAMGYGDEQVDALEQTINAVPCDLVLIGTPFDLAGLLKGIKHPMERVTYGMDQPSAAKLEVILNDFLAKI